MNRAVLRATAVLVMAGACSGRPGTSGSARVVVETVAGARHPVRVELARTDAERSRGLMHRDRLDEDAGMLFLFPESEEHAFWMKDTPLSLDLVFIGEDGRIVGIVERAPPRTLDLRTVGLPSRYVLEVNGGWSAARGVKAGDRVKFENVPRF